MSINRVFLAWNSAMFKNAFLFNKTKVSVVNWLSWIKNCNTFSVVPSIINVNAKNAFSHYIRLSYRYSIALPEVQRGDHPFLQERCHVLQLCRHRVRRHREWGPAGRPLPPAEVLPPSWTRCSRRGEGRDRGPAFLPFPALWLSSASTSGTPRSRPDGNNVGHFWLKSFREIS